MTKSAALRNGGTQGQRAAEFGFRNKSAKFAGFVRGPAILSAQGAAEVVKEKHPASTDRKRAVRFRPRRPSSHEAQGRRASLGLYPLTYLRFKLTHYQKLNTVREFVRTPYNSETLLTATSSGHGKLRSSPTEA